MLPAGERSSKVLYSKLKATNTLYCRYLQQIYIFFVNLKGNTVNVSSISNGIRNTTANLQSTLCFQSRAVVFAICQKL